MGWRSALKTVLEKDASRRLRQGLERWRHARGAFTWPTKSYEVWLVLQTELFLVRPQTLVELGSGRSTNFLAEYSFKMEARLVSIEEHRHYAKKGNRVLRDSFLPDNLIHHVPLRNDWYEESEITRLLRSLDAPIECIFVDGPSQVGPGDRASPSFVRCVIPHLESVKLAIIDDVHRPECEIIATELANTFALTRHDMRYRNRNAIAFLHSAEAEGKVAQLPAFLKELLVPGGISLETPPRES